eukprot:gene14087-16609_t
MYAIKKNITFASRLLCWQLTLRLDEWEVETHVVDSDTSSVDSGEDNVVELPVKKIKTTATTSPSSASPASDTTTSTSVEDDDNYPKDRPVRVYADGIYDLFHTGHARSLKQAKTLFPNTYLIVGVCNDEITHRLKGRTVMNHAERAESLRHCKWVDEVVENAPWVITQEFIDEHAIDFVSHGEDPCLDNEGNDIYKFVKDQGKMRTIKRTDGISTSDIILRIVKDYDNYVKRNLKRGYTGKDMNVNIFKEKTLQFEEKINEFKTKVRSSVDQIKLWSTEHHITDFLRKFSKRIPQIKNTISSPSQDYFSPEDFSYDRDSEYLTSPRSPPLSP